MNEIVEQNSPSKPELLKYAQLQAAAEAVLNRKDADGKEIPLSGDALVAALV